jgi:predicted GIY-YIG superfamily endonuclease
MGGLLEMSNGVDSIGNIYKEILTHDRFSSDDLLPLVLASAAHYALVSLELEQHHLYETLPPAEGQARRSQDCASELMEFINGPFGSLIPRYKPNYSYVYLLHFSERYKHAGHYLGSAHDLEERLARHRAGNGARLIEVITQAGIDFEISRLWRFDTCEEARAWEHTLKRRQHNGRECPICQGKPFDVLVSMRRGYWPFHLFPQGKPRRPMSV